MPLFQENSHMLVQGTPRYCLTTTWRLPSKENLVVLDSSISVWHSSLNAFPFPTIFFSLDDITVSSAKFFLSENFVFFRCKTRDIKSVDGSVLKKRDVHKRNYHLSPLQVCLSTDPKTFVVWYFDVLSDLKLSFPGKTIRSPHFARQCIFLQY